MRRAPILCMALPLVWLLAACAGTRSKPNNGDPPPPPGYLHGTVTTAHAAEGCPFLVQLDDATGREDPFLLPIALDPRFLQDGLKLRFTYRPSRAPSGQCLKGQPAILEDISLR
jgi:hypothetical protein